jgi:hypothetical protein
MVGAKEAVKTRKGAKKARKSFFAPFVLIRLLNHVTSGNQYSTAQVSKPLPTE